MADVQHSSLTDPELHEPKGASTATSGEVFVADGAGSGSWGNAGDIEATKTLANNGSTELPGGLIIKFGQVTASGGIGAVTFTDPFPNAALSATVSGFFPTDTGGTSSGPQLRTLTTSALSITSGSGVVCSWIAIGY